MVVQEDGRKYPLKRPTAHKVPVPRWTLKLPEDITHIYTLYIGVQSHSEDQSAIKRAGQSVQEWLDGSSGQATAVDVFRVTHGFDVVDSKVWVAYWTEPEGFSTKVKSLDLQKLWNHLGSDKKNVGLWREYFITPIERLETNYASLKHQPGLAQIPGSEFPEHNLTAYWGAGRDRIPAAAYDLFKPPEHTEAPLSTPTGVGERLTGTNYDNMCHIRKSCRSELFSICTAADVQPGSGQWWTQCDSVEREAYEGDDGLQKTLMNGMQYLWDHPDETGTIGLRFLQNLDADNEPIRETCGAGFHRNWEDLEQWSSRHPSHLAIFNGAMRHAKRFGPDRNFMQVRTQSLCRGQC